MAIFGNQSTNITDSFNVAGNMKELAIQQDNQGKIMSDTINKFMAARDEMAQLQAQTGAILSSYGVDESGKPDPSAPKYVHDLFNSVNKEGGIANLSRSQMIAGLQHYDTGTKVEQQRNALDMERIKVNQIKKALKDQEDTEKALEATEKARKALPTKKTGTVKELVYDLIKREDLDFDENTKKTIESNISELNSARQISDPEERQKKINEVMAKSFDLFYPLSNKGKKVGTDGKENKDYEEAINPYRRPEKLKPEDKIKLAAGQEFAGKLENYINEEYKKWNEFNKISGNEIPVNTESISKSISNNAEFDDKVIKAKTSLKNSLKEIFKKGEVPIGENQTIILNKALKDSGLVDDKGNYNDGNYLKEYRATEGDLINNILTSTLAEFYKDIGINQGLSKSEYSDAFRKNFGFQKTDFGSFVDTELTTQQRFKKNELINSALNKISKSIEKTSKENIEAKKLITPYSPSKFTAEAGDKYKEREIEVQKELQKTLDEQVTDAYELTRNYMMQTRGSVPVSFTKQAYAASQGIVMPVVMDTGTGHSYIKIGGVEKLVENAPIGQQNLMSISDQQRLNEAANLGKAKDLNGLEANGFSFTGEINVNDINMANKVRGELLTNTRALQDVERLINIAENSSALDKLLPAELTGYAQQIQNSIQAAKRTEVGGSGAWSEQDQQRIDKIITDPTSLRNVVFRDQCLGSLKGFRERLTASLKDQGTTYGFKFTLGSVKDQSMSSFRASYSAFLARGYSPEQARQAAMPYLNGNTQ